MIYNDIDLNTKCVSAQFDAGTLKLVCTGIVENTMQLVLISNTDQQYLNILMWAINKGLITPT